MTGDGVTADLGDLLAGAAAGMLQAQDTLDARALAQTATSVSLPDGSLELPPLWFHVRAAQIEVSMAAMVSEGRLACRLVNPLSVALYGYQASAGTTVRLTITPGEG